MKGRAHLTYGTNGGQMFRIILLSDYEDDHEDEKN